jgi:hypothetical protein
MGKISNRSVYCMFCRGPMQKCKSTDSVPRHISENELFVWESAPGLRRDDFRNSHRFHTSHFEDK